jgi:hypothetical protein
MSGYSDAILETQGTQKGFPLIRKPFLAASLIQKIHAIVGTANAASQG